MKTYRVVYASASGVYRLYDGDSQITVEDWNDLFGSAGEAYLKIEYVTGSSAALYISSPSGASPTYKNFTFPLYGKLLYGIYKVTWDANTTSFTSTKLELGNTLTKEQLSFLMGKIKASDEKIQALGNYSAAEVNTGTTWIDGSPIYKKTFGIGQLPNAGQSSTDPSISNIGTVIKIEGIGVESSGLAFPLPMPGSNSVELWWNASASRLNCQTSGDRSAATGYVTMYYTKSS